MSLGPLHPPRRLLLGPGPSMAHPAVLAALGQPLIGHLDPAFTEIMNECQEMLRAVMQTKNLLTFPVSGTGSAGMETAVVNLIEPGDAMLVGVNGVFGGRMTDVAGRAGARVTTITRPWGETFTPEEIRAALKKEKPKVFGIVHAETSTGAAQKIEGLAEICRETGTLLLVDAVTSLAGMPVLTDEWQIDALYSGTQKCLSCPPGLAPVSFSATALDVIEKRKTKVQSWYLDMSMVKRYWGDERFYHHTAPISMIYALREALRIVTEEGLPARYARHAKMHLALKAGLDTLDMDFVPKADERLPMLNAVRVPAGLDEAKARKFLLLERGIEIGGGLGELKGKAVRIGLMGEGARPESVRACLDGLEDAFKDQGLSVKRGAAKAAAEAFFT